MSLSFCELLDGLQSRDAEGCLPLEGTKSTTATMARTIRTSAQPATMRPVFWRPAGELPERAVDRLAKPLPDGIAPLLTAELAPAADRLATLLLRGNPFWLEAKLEPVVATDRLAAVLPDEAPPLVVLLELDERPPPAVEVDGWRREAR